MAEKKKMVVIYGNCHTSIIEEMLLSSSSFNDKYFIYPTKRIHEIKNPQELYNDCYRQCDVFIHQSIRLGNRYGDEYASENIISRLKPECKVIAIPNVYRLPKCFFPQYSDAPELKKGITYFFRDSIIDSKIGNHNFFKIFRDVKQDYSNGNLFEKSNIVDAFNGFIDKVIYREKDWDIKVSQFIMDNYQKHQLFYDPNHPTNYFLAFVVVKLLVILNCKDVEEKSLGKLKDNLENIEMPICQAVTDALKLKWRETSIRREHLGTKRIPLKLNMFWYFYHYYICLWMVNDFPKTTRKISRVLWRVNEFVFFIYRILRKVFGIMK